MGFWAPAISQKPGRPGRRPAGVAKALGEKAAEIDACLIAVQGKPVDTGGCCHPDKKKVSAALRPCPNLNAIIDAL